MRRTLSKIIGATFIVLIVLNIFIANINISRALSDVTENPDIWLSEGEDIGESQLNSKARPILSIIRVVGIVVSVVTLAIIALRIMFASVEEKASYKQTLMPWLTGAVMLFTMTTLPGIIYDIVKVNEDALPKKREMWFCPYGNAVQTELVDIEGTDNDQEQVYTCTKQGCPCNLKKSEKGATLGYGCTKCKVKLTGTKQNYCKLCGSYYK